MPPFTAEMQLLHSSQTQTHRNSLNAIYFISSSHWLHSRKIMHFICFECIEQLRCMEKVVCLRLVCDSKTYGERLHQMMLWTVFIRLGYVRLDTILFSLSIWTNSTFANTNYIFHSKLALNSTIEWQLIGPAVCRNWNYSFLSIYYELLSAIEEERERHQICISYRTFYDLIKFRWSPPHSISTHKREI